MIFRCAVHRSPEPDAVRARCKVGKRVCAGHIAVMALDQDHDEIMSGEVVAEPDSPSAELLAAWLSTRLGVAVDRTVSEGPGITGVKLTTAGGDIVLDRPDGRVATLCRPGQPDRQVSLMRRPMAELLAEELRRLDPDEVYQEAAARFAKDLTGGVTSEGLASEPVSATAAAATTEAAGQEAEETGRPAGPEAALRPTAPDPTAPEPTASEPTTTEPPPPQAAATPPSAARPPAPQATTPQATESKPSAHEPPARNPGRDKPVGDA